MTRIHCFGDRTLERSSYSQVFSQFKGETGELIPILQELQDVLGYVSEESVEKTAEFLGITENEIFGVASFYSQFRFEKPGRNIIRVCTGTACHVGGGQWISETIERELGIKPGQTTSDGKYRLTRVACLGCCALAPVVQINDTIYGRMTANRLKDILKQYE